MLQPKHISLAAPAGDSCSRSRSAPTPYSDFAEFGDFEQELLDAIELAEQEEAADDKVTA